MAYVEEKQSMDAAASSQTQYSLFVGDSFKGIFSDNLDKDWVRVELVAGKTYQISLSGTGSNSGADTILTVFNSVGEQVAANDDADFAAGQLNSKLAFSPEASGVYYLSAGAYAGNPTQDHSGDYTLTLVDTEADGAGGRADDVKQEGGAGNDVLRDGAGDDVLRGGTGNDNLYGLGGQDFLTGDSGDDLLEGGDDADLMLGDSAPAMTTLMAASAMTGWSAGRVLTTSKAVTAMTSWTPAPGMTTCAAAPARTGWTAARVTTGLKGAPATTCWPAETAMTC